MRPYTSSRLQLLPDSQHDGDQQPLERPDCSLCGQAARDCHPGHSNLRFHEDNFDPCHGTVDDQAADQRCQTCRSDLRLDLQAAADQRCC